MSPPALSGISEVSLIPLFYICSLVLLPNLVTLSVSFFSAFGPFSGLLFSLNLHFPKGRLFCVALVFVSFSV